MQTAVSRRGFLFWLIYSGIHSAFIFWYRRRRQKRLEVKIKCLRLLLDGYILVDSINPSSKEIAWIYSILPQLSNHWQKVHGEKININDSSSWPCPVNGVSYESNLTTADQTLYPKLFSNNLEIQNLISYLFDDSVRFDMQSTSFFHSLAIFFEYLWNGNKNIIVLSGNDHGWNLINWQQSKFPSGHPVSNKTHIDGGEAFHYKQGLPISTSTATAIYNMKIIDADSSSVLISNVPKLQARLSILSMLLWQIAIIFYCDTPGDLSIEEGVTGFFKGSHIPILHSLHRFMYTSYSSLPNTSEHIPSVVDYTTFATAIKQFGEFTKSDRLEQHSIPDGKALLCFGPVAHTLMWCTKAMRCMPRSMQNAKILGDRSKLFSTDTLVEMAMRINPQSLIGRLADDPETFLSYARNELNNLCEEKMDILHESEMLKRDSNFLFERFTKSV